MLSSRFHHFRDFISYFSFHLKIYRTPSRWTLFAENWNVLIAPSIQVITENISCALAKCASHGTSLLFCVSRLYEYVRAPSPSNKGVEILFFLWWFTATLSVRCIERKVSINVYILVNEKRRQQTKIWFFFFLLWSWNSNNEHKQRQSGQTKREKSKIFIINICSDMSIWQTFRVFFFFFFVRSFVSSGSVPSSHSSSRRFCRCNDGLINFFFFCRFVKNLTKSWSRDDSNWMRLMAAALCALKPNRKGRSIHQKSFTVTSDHKPGRYELITALLRKMHFHSSSIRVARAPTAKRYTHVAALQLNEM